MYTSHALTTGFVLQGDKYKISKVLGNGGFGITYLATHNFLEKQVAIKEVYSPTFCKRNNNGSLTGLSDNFDVFKRNFFAEARTLAKFSNNKNIVQVSDIFNENNTIYFVMDYVEGHSLQEFIDKKGILPFSQAIKYIIDILTALIEVHQNNILHRDIKPANLLIRNLDKEIILIDFGIAREFTQDETLTQTAMISVGYAPPEQSISSHKRTASVDLYSVGAVLYFCLTGKRPQTNDERSIEDYISAKQLNSAIPKNLDDLIIKAMQRKPHERFQSAEEMINGLKGLSQVNVNYNLTVPAKSNENNQILIDAKELYILGCKYHAGKGVEQNYELLY
jgi:serine/threonine protein kinase